MRSSDNRPYNWNRHYDATTGRHTQTDPLGLNRGSKISWDFLISSMTMPSYIYNIIAKSYIDLYVDVKIAESEKYNLSNGDFGLGIDGLNNYNRNIVLRDGASIYSYVHQTPLMKADISGSSPAAVSVLCIVNPGLCAGAAAVAAAIIGKICEPLFSRKSGKEHATDTPRWAKSLKPEPGQSGKEFADKVMDDRYGKGNYKTGAGTDYNKLKKYGDRSK